MEDNNFDPILVEKAKRMAAGPLAKEMCKFPLRFAAPASFGQRPISSPNPKVKNGTAALLDLGHGPIAVTCYHVLEEYRKDLIQDEQIIFQVGNLGIEPLERIIDQSKDLDLATIDLSGENVKEIGRGEEIGSDFFHPISWPPKDIKEGDFVAFGGFPGCWRSQPSRDKIFFDSFSSGAQMVTSAGEDYFVCQLEREYWINAFKLHQYEDLHDLGGLSGSPVFILRDLHFDFIGIVYQFSSEFDLMYIRPSKFINEDGTISQ